MLMFRCYNTVTNTAQVYNEIPYSLVQVRTCQLNFKATFPFRVFSRVIMRQSLLTAKQGQESHSQCRRILTILVSCSSLWFLRSEMISSVPGLIPRAIVHIFEGKEAEEDDETLFDVRVSYIEIYNEEIRDLLGDDVTKKLEIKVRNKVEGEHKQIFVCFYSKTVWKV